MNSYNFWKNCWSFFWLINYWENIYFVGLFKLSDSDDVFYKFNTEKVPTEELI